MSVIIILRQFFSVVPFFHTLLNIRNRYKIVYKEEIFIMRMVRHENSLLRCCGCPIPGSVKGQVGQGFGQPGLAGGVPPTQTIL